MAGPRVDSAAKPIRRDARGWDGAVTRTVCPSGLRGWTQVPLARAAWVQIPQLSFFFRTLARVMPVQVLGGSTGGRGGGAAAHRGGSLFRHWNYTAFGRVVEQTDCSAMRERPTANSAASRKYERAHQNQQGFLRRYVMALPRVDRSRQNLPVPRGSLFQVAPHRRRNKIKRGHGLRQNSI